MRMREPEPVTNLVNENVVASGAGLKLALRKKRKQAVDIPHPGGTAARLRKDLNSGPSPTTEVGSPSLRNGSGRYPRLEQIRGRGRGNLLECDIRHIGPFL